MKKFLVLLITVTSILSLAACGGGKSSAKKVAIMTPYLSSVTTNEMVKKVKAEGEKKGWNMHVVDTKGDVGQLASRMEDEITKHVNAIVIVSIDPNQIKAQIQSAKQAKIPVFGCDSGSIDGVVANATSDNQKMSEMISQYLFEKMGKKGKLVVLTHRPHPGVLKRTLKLDEMLKQNTGITKVTEQHIQVPGPIESARKQTESLLLANKEPGSITAVWAGWDEPAIGAAQAIQAANRNDIIVTGIDGNSQAIEMIKKGSPLVATVKQNFTGMADIIVKQIDLVLQGKQVEGKELYAPASLITKESLSK
ncbi:monosaccharide ABC transporter substrate-binding protein, CUT2 family [Seinonella peptonophila]|uniref:Monosaccharide ABC transporter substrate-binding protein, CUT2 family n=1 Tax=Seinonella peptonophila TaxID=112248 RepID=A0A1M4X980_9BACL|nr:substrate-binding domain-containing protein [Seinonella peptonophila]SHE90033.1 monosaccharide ABC transporter substrate-binding protein, CUT2 family [Seinonella peptonophila]